jgi:hypothetical protein
VAESATSTTLWDKAGRSTLRHELSSWFGEEHDVRESGKKAVQKQEARGQEGKNETRVDAEPETEGSTNIEKPLLDVEHRRRL